MFTINKLNKNPDAHKNLNSDGPSIPITVLPGVPIFCKFDSVSNAGPYTIEFDW